MELRLSRALLLLLEYAVIFCLVSPHNDLHVSPLYFLSPMLIFYVSRRLQASK